MPSPVIPARHRVSLWRDGDFRRLWVGQTASQFGAQAGQVTLPLIAVVALNAGAAQLGVLRAVQQAPILLFSLFVGVWVDRRRSRTVMVLADLGRAAALAAIPITYLLGMLGTPALLVVAFLVGVLTVAFDVAYQASLVRLVERDQLAQGNSALEGSRSAAQVGGPALGGAMVSLLSAPIAIVVSAFFFTLSFLTIRRIRRPEPIPQHAEPPTRVLRQIHEGLRLVVGDTSLRAVGLASGIFQFSFAALMTVYLLFLPRTLHLSGAAVGLALAAMGPGALAGSLLSAGLPGRFGHGVVLVSSAALADGVMLCVPALHGSTAVTISLLMTINFVFGVFSQIVDVTVMAVRQAITPMRIQGRVVATINFVGMGLTPLGSLLGGYLAGEWGLRTSLLLTAVGVSLSPLFMALSPLARLGRTLPPAHQATGLEEPGAPGLRGSRGRRRPAGTPGSGPGGPRVRRGPLRSRGRRLR
ncbi:MFS transporter [Actinoallomurus purpureus]|uniref:MFS transporter n=1 Tax=Actinoallomurus purpureus TaxID=478114 RepID=UPI00209234C2|nr:MFS transporter [Actinoallomurus purpureus]MCO6006880.1 MFS transporter [Actinoallomurus purpureus]